LWIDLESAVLSGWDEPILRNAHRAGFQLNIVMVADISGEDPGSKYLSSGRATLSESIPVGRLRKGSRDIFLHAIRKFASGHGFCAFEPRRTLSPTFRRGDSLTVPTATCAGSNDVSGGPAIIGRGGRHRVGCRSRGSFPARSGNRGREAKAKKNEEKACTDMKLDAGRGELDGSWRCRPRLSSKVGWRGKK
jgi:hypothetical protein